MCTSIQACTRRIAYIPENIQCNPVMDIKTLVIVCIEIDFFLAQNIVTSISLYLYRGRK